MLRNDIAPCLPLDGTWDFALGEEAPWGTIRVPGCWEAQGYSKYVDGPARYRRQVPIPPEWAGARILLEFDAVSYACMVHFNGVQVGQHRGLWMPFAVNVTSAARPGQMNTVELEVFKPGDRYPLRSCLAGFLPDVATAFGGIWQSARLRAVAVGLDDLLIDPNPETGQLRVRCKTVAFANTSGSSLTVEVFHDKQLVAAEAVPVRESDAVDATLTVPDAMLWSPERPALYNVRVRLSQAGHGLAEARERVGFRRLSTDGDQLLFNGQPAFLRGVLSWGWDPQRIAPAFERAQVRDELRRIRELGFNLIKLCLFVPDQTYFDVADEEGMFLWQEWPLWLPEITAEMRREMPAQYASLMRLTRHHPSVIAYSLGCELGETVDAELVRQLDQTVRGLASGTLFCDNSGSGEAYGGLPYDFSDFSDYHPYADIHHFVPLLDHWRRDWQPPRPWILGEFCDSDGFRDLDEIIAANDGQKPWWMSEDNPVHTWRPEARALLEQHERLAQAGLKVTPQELVWIANRQSLMVRKFILETVRRRSGMGGYVVTGLRDTPITTSGVFDDLGRTKWPPDEFRPFNDDAALCLDVGRGRRWVHGGDRAEQLDPYNWWAGEEARLCVILSHTMPSTTPTGEVVWQLAHLDGDLVTTGRADVRETIPPGSPRELAAIELTLPLTQGAQELQLEVRFSTTSFEIANRWPLWVYPRPGEWPANLAIYDPCYALDDPLWAEIGQRIASRPAPGERFAIIATAFSPWLNDYLQDGGQVVLLQHGDGPLPARRGPFWREAIKLFADHPLWGLFPHCGYADLQFFGLATDVMLELDNLDKVVPGLRRTHPIMRRLDAREFHITEYLLEAKVGAGRLLACTLRPQGGLGAQPRGLKSNVAGHYLLWAMIRYLAR